MVGVRHFLQSNEFRNREPKSNSVTDWITKQGIIYKEASKFEALNFTGVLDLALNPNNDTAKPTIKWRAHEGTVDGERVVAWVKVVAGIVDFACYAYPSDLHTLLKASGEETWEKTGNPEEDEKLEKRYGPILAEGGFTVRDLFEWMGLDESAEFYKDKAVRIEKRIPPLRATPFITWPHDTDQSLPKEERERLDHRKDLFLTLRECTQQEVSGVEFDPFDPYWAPYVRNKEDIDRITDASTPDLESPSDSIEELTPSGSGSSSEPTFEEEREFRRKRDESSVLRRKREARREARWAGNGQVERLEEEEEAERKMYEDIIATD